VDWERFDRALFRCMNDIEIVKAQRTAHVELRRVVQHPGSVYSGFPGLANAAFNTSTQGGLALILETHKSKGRSGFWWLHDCALKHVQGYAPGADDVAFLADVSSEFKVLRDKTLFHISAEAVQNPGRLRQESGLTYTRMDKAISLVQGMLGQLYELRLRSNTWTQGMRRVTHLDYDGSDVAVIFRSR
jgi:hypothetical protein